MFSLTERLEFQKPALVFMHHEEARNVSAHDRK